MPEIENAAREPSTIEYINMSIWSGIIDSIQGSIENGAIGLVASLGGPVRISVGGTELDNFLPRARDTVAASRIRKGYDDYLERVAREAARLYIVERIVPGAVAQAIDFMRQDGLLPAEAEATVEADADAETTTTQIPLEILGVRVVSRIGSSVVEGNVIPFSSDGSMRVADLLGDMSIDDLIAATAQDDA